MYHTDNKSFNNNTKKRLETISIMLREIRFSEGKNQSDFTEEGLSRRKIQQGEYATNLTLKSLFDLLDCYGYRLDEFFYGME